MFKKFLLLLLSATFCLSVYPQALPVLDFAEFIGIVDSGNFYTGDEVETALQEIGDGTTLDDRYVNVTGDTMEGALNMGGFTLFGDTIASGDLTLVSTTDASKGLVILGNATTGLIYSGDNESATIGGGTTIHTVNGVSEKALWEFHQDGAIGGGGTVYHSHQNDPTASSDAVWLKSAGDHDNPLIVADGEQLGHLRFAGYDGTDYAMAAEMAVFVDGTPGNDDMGGRFSWSTSLDGTQTLVEHLCLDNAGVLIGNFSNTAAADFDWQSDDGSNLLYADVSADSGMGRVGIGTSTPGQKLQILGSGINMGINITNANSVNFNLLTLSASAKVGTVSSHAFEIMTNNTIRQVWDTSGRTGINESSPDAMLEVVSNSSTEEVIKAKGAASQSVPLILATDNSDVPAHSFSVDGAKIMANAGGDVTFHEDGQVADNQRGKFTTFYRNAPEGLDFIRFFVDQFQSGRILSTVDLKFDAGENENFSIGSQVRGQNVIIGAFPEVGQNPWLQHRGWISTAGQRIWVQFQLSDTTDMYELIRFSDDILGFDIQMPLKVTLDTPTEEGLTIKGAASQSASLLLLTDSSNNPFIDSGDGLNASVFAGNEQADDIDFRWKGNTEENLFRIDAGLDEVRMGDWDTNYFTTDKIGDTWWVGDGTGVPFGHAYMFEGNTTVSVASADTWYELTSGLTAGELNEVTLGGSHNLTVGIAGRYKVSWSASIETTSANQELMVSITVNSADHNTALNSESTNAKSAANHATVVAGNKSISLSGNTILDLAASDEVSMIVLNKSLSTDIVIEHITLSATQIGGT